MTLRHRSKSLYVAFQNSCFLWMDVHPSIPRQVCIHLGFARQNHVESQIGCLWMTGTPKRHGELSCSLLNVYFFVWLSIHHVPRCSVDQFFMAQTFPRQIDMQLDTWRWGSLGIFFSPSEGLFPRPARSSLVNTQSLSSIRLTHSGVDSRAKIHRFLRKKHHNKRAQGVMQGVFPQVIQILCKLCDLN